MRLPFNVCQPGTASCGACCGLYSVRARGKDELAALLRKRTGMLKDLPRTAEAYGGAARQVRAEESPGRERLSDPSPLCAMLGFLDARESRIGCLGHPIVTGGPDLRICGTYQSAKTCEDFVCPSAEAIALDEATLVRDACADWHLYGLVVADLEFVRACIALVEVGGRIRGPESLPAWRDLFELKAGVPLEPLEPCPPTRGEEALRPHLPGPLPESWAAVVRKRVQAVQVLQRR